MKRFQSMHRIHQAMAIGFTLLLTSSALIGIWAYLGKHRGILFLQFFYAAAGIIGMIRWF
jgi:hypothetical protein